MGSLELIVIVEMARIMKMYTNEKINLTKANLQSEINPTGKRTYTVICYTLGDYMIGGNRDVIQHIYSGTENDLPSILNHVRTEHPKAKIELYINELRLNISSIEVIAFC